MTNCKSYYNVKDSTLSISKNLRPKICAGTG